MPNVMLDAQSTPRGLPAQSVLSRIHVAATIFLAAFLLFAVEPLIAKMILPWFGGSAGVWIACLLFFQAVLLAGYAYAHLLTNRLAPRRQWHVHLMLLALSLLVLPIIPTDTWKPDGASDPLARILALLTATIGLPFLLLASTGPLVQAWVARAQVSGTRADIYRLYALSNFASLLALLGYPILIEPLLPARAQAWAWSIVYFAFVLLAASLAFGHRDALATHTRAKAVPGERPPFSNRLLWLLLATVPSALLLAVTNHMLRNIAAIPLLWVLPLSLYLVSFIVCFDRPRWYYRPLWYGLLPAAVGILILSAAAPFFSLNYPLQLGLNASAFFICCMVCHGELAALKPEPRALTSFYLTVASGGAIGGLSIAAIAPAVSNYDHDLPIMLLVFSSLVAGVAWWPARASLPSWARWNTAMLVIGVASIVFAILFGPLRYVNGAPLLALRNFYGPLQVTITPANGARAESMQLQNGNIMHGRQFTPADRRCEPLAYYSRGSGLGAAMAELAAQGPLNVGVIGLGAGTTAAYGRPGDVFRFYELNPQVGAIAQANFNYLSCAERWTIAIGDARLSLEGETPRDFDILTVDAFTGDAIPVHLLTHEAFALYWRHIKTGGVLAVHVSNSFIDLAPVVARAAAETGYTARLLSAGADIAQGISESHWVLVAQNPDFFARPAFKNARPIETAGAGRVWTDDYSNIWRALKW